MGKKFNEIFCDTDGDGSNGKKKVDSTRWMIFILLIFSLKFLVFCIDPLPMFYLGDSQSYIGTALTGWIPPDRSFVYGFVIKFTAVAARSLTTLIALQIFTSGLNAILLAYALQKFLSVAPNISFFCGLFCALEPLQLMYERYIMTEALSLFVFTVYMIVIFHYLKHPRLVFLGLLQIIGTVLISFRLSFLPLVLINTILLPLLIIPTLSSRNLVKWQPFKTFLSNASSTRPFWGVVALHLIFSIGLTYSLHLGYKTLNGLLSRKPPAYQYQSGIFLLAYWAPIVRPVDFPRPDLSDTVFRDLKYDLGNRHRRAENHWSPGGLIAHVNEAIPDVLEADHVARQTALNAFKRDPGGLVSLTVSTFMDYWNLKILRPDMQSDRGDRVLPEEMLESLSSYFNLSANSLPFLKTFTSRFFLAAWPWYLFLLCIPFFAFVDLLICSREIWRYVFVVFLAVSEIVLVASALVEGPTVRYLHSLGWLSFLIIGTLLDWALVKWRARSLPKAF